MIKLIAVLILFSVLGCSTAQMQSFGKALSAAGESEPNESPKFDNSNQVKFVTKDGEVIGHQYGNRVVYQDGSSGYVR